MMGQQRKTRVGVISGGRSGEHDVSLRSARAVMGELDPERFEVVPIGIDRQIPRPAHVTSARRPAMMKGDSVCDSDGDVGTS